MTCDRTARTRREFLQGSLAAAGFTLLSGCGPLPFAPQARISRIGSLTLRHPDVQSWMEGWERGLSDLGYVDGRNIAIERRIAERNEGFAELVTDLVQRKVDLIMAAGWAAMHAAKQATDSIPIVGVSTDPVGTGLVASFSRPGGNVTGLTTLSVGLAAKRVQLFKEAIAGLTRAGIVWNSLVPDRALEFRETQEAGRALGLDLLPLEVQSPMG